MKKLLTTLLLVIFLLTFTKYSNSQFVGTTGPSGGTVNTLLCVGNNTFAGTASGGVFMTSDNGASWNAVNNGITTFMDVTSLTAIGSTVFAGISGVGIFKTTNNGTMWVRMDSASTFRVSALGVNGTDLYMGTYDGYLYRSTNYGSTWTLLADLSSIRIYSIISANNAIYVGGQYVSVSTDNGATWHSEAPWGGYMYAKALYAMGSTIRAGTNGGAYRNTNQLGGWVVDLPWGNFIQGFASAGNYILDGGYPGIYWSSDNGSTWHDPSYDFMYGNNVTCMAQNGVTLFAGTSSNVFSRPISQLNGIKQTSSNVPSDFSLNQNYPNPFNPSTKINFALPKSDYVTLKIYNQLGQETAVLVNEKLSAGSYEYNFDASHLASGIYFYKLTTGSFTQTKKMMLIK